MQSLPCERFAFFCPPRRGKTFTLRLVAQHFPMGGRILTPLPREYVNFQDVDGTVYDVGDRWDVGKWPAVPDPVHERGEFEAMFEWLGQTRPGEAVIIDEAGRYFLDPHASRYGVDPLLDWLDLARNHGVRFGLASKRATSVPPLVPDLVDAFLYQVPRSASGKEWLVRAGCPVDLGPLPAGTFYCAGVTEEFGLVTSDGFARDFSRGLLTLSEIPGTLLTETADGD